MECEEQRWKEEKEERERIQQEEKARILREQLAAHQDAVAQERLQHERVLREQEIQRAELSVAQQQEAADALRRTEKEQEQQFAISLQNQARLHQQKMLDVQERVQKEQGLICRIAKFSGKEPVNMYLYNLEHNLEQDGILPARWLRILENTLSGEALHVYWNVFTTEQRESYAASKATLTAWQGETAHGCIDRFMNGRKKFQDTPMQAFQDSIFLAKLLTEGNEFKE